MRRDKLIALKYTKYFNKSVVYLSLSNTLRSVQCQLVSGKYVFTDLMIEHQLMSPNKYDTRPRIKICDYHEYCAINFLSEQTIQTEKDVELAAFYAAALVYNSFLANPTSIFVIGGTLVEKHRQFFAQTKCQLEAMAGNFNESFVAGQILVQASSDASVAGGLVYLEKELNDKYASRQF